MDIATALLTGLGSYVGLRLLLEALREGRTRRARAEARRRGAGEPTTLHPWVDPERCVCSGLCIRACPEDAVLGIIEGRAQVIHASHCVGHARCVEACPTQAVELIFGSEARGVQVPRLARDFETNVPGIYVAGELGGMGLIANAVSQGAAAGAAAMASIRGPGGSDTAEVDVLVVGAGPAGLAAALRVQEEGGRYLLLDQEEWGGAIRHYPRRNLVMTEDLRFPGYGTVTRRTLLKEELIEILGNVVTSEGLVVRERERVLRVEREEAGFVVHSSGGVHRARRVVLAVGRRGRPRKLEVPGEDREKVLYELRDPEQFEDLDILVVGGGDSALQAALALSAGRRNRVVLSYRQGRFTRPKKANKERLAEALAAGELQAWMGSRVRRIEEREVVLERDGEPTPLPNDFVFAMTGGVLPTDLLTEVGVEVEFHFGREVRYF